jgi:hypothetical protein
MERNSNQRPGHWPCLLIVIGNVAGVLSRRNRGEHTIPLSSATHFSVWRYSVLSPWVPRYPPLLNFMGDVCDRGCDKGWKGLLARTQSVLMAKPLLVDDGRSTGSITEFLIVIDQPSGVGYILRSHSTDKTASASTSLIPSGKSDA